jgi:hypothetical protein
MPKLSNYQWAIVWALVAEPDYYFTGEERKAADRLVTRKVLVRRTTNRFRFSAEFRRQMEREWGRGRHR